MGYNCHNGVQRSLEPHFVNNDFMLLLWYGPHAKGMLTLRVVRRLDNIPAPSYSQ